MAPTFFSSNPPSVPNLIQTTPANPFVGPAYIQIPNLPPVAGLTGADQMEVVQFGVSRHLTMSDILNFTISSAPILPVPRGGTGTNFFSNDGVLYGTGTAPLRSTGQGGPNTVLVANGGSPFFSDAITVGTSVTTPLLIAGTLVIGSITIGALTVDTLVANISIDGPIGNIAPNSGIFTSITNTSLTPGRIIYSGVGGLETDSPNLTFDGTRVTSTEFSGPIGTSFPNLGFFTDVTSGTGDFTTSLMSPSITDSSLGNSEVVYAGLGGLLKSDISFLFNNITSTLTVPNAHIDRIHSATNILELGAFDGFSDATAITIDATATTILAAFPTTVVNTLTVLGLHAPLQPQVPTLLLTYVGSTGTIAFNVPGIPFSSYNLNLPIDAGMSGHPLLSGGGGTTSMFYGGISGNTPTFATTFGVFTPGNIIISDASGNFIDGGSPTPGTVNPGLINELGYYATSGSTISGLPTANDGVLITSGIGAPSISSILPSAVQTNITSLGIITIGTWHADPVDVIYGGTGLSFGASGGIPYFSSTITMASTGTLSLNDPVIGGGLGGAPTTGTRSGNTTNFATVSGALISTHFVLIDANGNLIDSGSPPSLGSVNPGLINQLGYYASSGSTISGLSTANNGVLITSAGGVPSISSTLPLAVQTNVTQLGTITVGIWNGSTNTVPFGGTGDTSFTLNGVLFGNGTSPLQVTAQAGANMLLSGNNGAPFFTDSPILGSSLTVPTIYGGSTNSSSLTLQSTSGVGVSDFVRIMTNGITRLVINNGGESTFTQHVLAPSYLVVGATSGIITIQPQAVAGTYNFNLPTSAGTSGQPLLSGGGGATPMTFGTLQPTGGGTGTTTNTLNGVLYGNGTSPILATAQGGANTVLTANGGAPIFSSSLTISSLTATTSITNSSLTSGRVIFSGAAGIETDSANLTFSGTILTSTGFSGPHNGTVGAITPASGAFTTLSASTSITNSAFATNRVVYTTTAGLFTTSSDLSFDGTNFITNIAQQRSSVFYTNTGTGRVSLVADPTNFTPFTMTWPTTAGTVGQVLTSQGGGATPMTWTTPDSGTVNSGTINQMAYYAATGTTVSGLTTANNSILFTTAAGAPHWPVNVANALVNTNGIGGGPQLTTNPFVAGSLTVPVLYGGQNASSSLTIVSTSGVGTTDFIQFATNNSLPRMIINTSGEICIGNADITATPIGGKIRAPSASTVNITGGTLTIEAGNGTGTGGSGQILFNAAAPGVSGSTSNTYSTVMNISSALGMRINSASNATSQLHLGVGSATAGTSPLKFISGTNMTTPESGAVEYDGTNLYVTNHAVRRNIACGNMNSIAATTLTTATTNFATINVVTGENYIFEFNLKLVVSGNTVITGFAGTNAGATDSTLEMFTNNVITPTAYSNLVINGGGTVTAPANMVMMRVTGFFTATGTGTFSVTLRTTAGTITTLAGSYFTYMQF